MFLQIYDRKSLSAVVYECYLNPVILYVCRVLLLLMVCLFYFTVINVLYVNKYDTIVIVSYLVSSIATLGVLGKIHTLPGVIYIKHSCIIQILYFYYKNYSKL